MGLFKKKQQSNGLAAMCQCEVRDISEACDVVFSKKMMGDGILLLPQEDLISSPCDAEVMMCFPSKHAIGLKLDQGVELLLHFGVDTIQLQGEGFDIKVVQGDHVKQGDLLWKADLAFIKAHAPSEAIMIIITANPNNLTFDKLLGKHKRDETILAFH